MTDLVSSLSSALDKREELAKEATPGPWRWATPASSTELHLMGQGFKPIVPLGEFFEEADAAFVAANDPSWVLRDCEAKRRVLARHRWAGDALLAAGDECLCANPWPCVEIRDLAYALGVEVPE